MIWYITYALDFCELCYEGLIVHAYKKISMLAFDIVAHSQIYTPKSRACAIQCFVRDNMEDRMHAFRPNETHPGTNINI